MKLSINSILLLIKYIFRYSLRPRAMLARRNIGGLKTYSHAGQDLFALLLLKRKHSGTYVEIGAQDPIKNSNSFLLENDYGWSGISFELRNDFYTFFSYRRGNPCIRADATALNYLEIFKNAKLPQQIDFLQVDIEPASATLAALRQLPHDHYRFSVITFEHDCYQAGPEVRQESRQFLTGKGYRIFAKDVRFQGVAFEDWWIDPKVFTCFASAPEPIYQNTEYDEIIRTLPKTLRTYSFETD